MLVCVRKVWAGPENEDSGGVWGGGVVVSATTVHRSKQTKRSKDIVYSEEPYKRNKINKISSMRTDTTREQRRYFEYDVT